MSYTWGNALAGESRRETDPSTYQEINPGVENYASCQSASHVLLFARTDKKAIHLYPRIAVVLMQMRFDGCLGFPGGLVEPWENPIEGVNREMIEEIGWDSEIFGSITQRDHMSSHYGGEKKRVFHFYAKELSEEHIIEIEKRSTSAIEHGDECLGLIHVPLYTMGDGFRGLPCFLKNNFVGNSKMQLLASLVNLKILTQNYIDQALTAKPVSPKQ